PVPPPSPPLPPQPSPPRFVSPPREQDFDDDNWGNDGWSPPRDVDLAGMGGDDQDRDEEHQRAIDEHDAKYDREAEAALELTDLVNAYAGCLTQNYGSGGGEALCLRLDPYVWVLEDWDDYTKVTSTLATQIDPALTLNVQAGKFVHITAMSREAIACQTASGALASDDEDSEEEEVERQRDELDNMGQQSRRACWRTWSCQRPFDLPLLRLPPPHSTTALAATPFRLPSDLVPATPLFNLSDIPAVFRLSHTSRCGTLGCLGVYDKNSDRRINQRPCKVYSTTGVIIRIIERQACTCQTRHKQTIGPDLVEHGIFNLNNQSLFTHELFSSLFTQLNTSATPLASFRLNVHRDYSNNPNKLPFLTPRAFNNVFYIVEKLYHLNTPDYCAQCGRFPEVLICDGVANCISNRNITPSLCPPTVPPPAGELPIVPDVGPGRNRPFLAQAPLRKRLIAALEQARSIDEPDEHDGGEAVDVASVRDVVAELRALPADRYLAEASLAPLLAQLANLGLTDRRPLFLLYVAFLLQVAAHEPVLQFAPVALAPSLRRFGTPGPHLAKHDADDIKWFASRCPSLARVLLFLKSHQLPVPEELRQLVFAIGGSVQTNYDRIATHVAPPTEPSLEDT
ncbi:hypothetical protein P7C70_g7903, partial [Phenoliferia sp. Uapishka_3]